MVIIQPTEDNPSYYYRASPAYLNCSECFQRHLMFCLWTTSEVTHRNGAIKHIFFTRIRSTEGSSADCSLFILSLHALALHLAVKILLQITLLTEDLSTLTLRTSVGCISTPECQQDRTLLRNQYY